MENEPVVIDILDGYSENLPVFACLTTNNGLNFSQRGNRCQINRWIRDMSILIIDAYSSTIVVRDNMTNKFGQLKYSNVVY